MAYTTINKSGDYFNTKLTTGTGNSQAVTGLGFQPDWIWGKRRDSTGHHSLFDAVRGITKGLESNQTGGEWTSTGYYSSFDSDGFTIASGAGGAGNGSGQTAVQWCWKANGQGSSNTDGSINTTYTSVNTTAGFSISKYTGTGSQATVGHGLGVAPKMIIVKRLQNAEDWAVYHASNGAGTYQSLNTTEAKQTNSNRFNVAPTSSVFTVNTHESVNFAENYIAYCFAEKTGYSKFGSYTGTGVAEGTFVYTGFKPAFILQKRTNSASTGWGIIDNTRSPINVSQNMLLANSNAVEDTSSAPAVDFLSNGFKWRTADGWFNGGGDPHIYMAFAEAPLVGTNNVPCTAR